MRGLLEHARTFLAGRTPQAQAEELAKWIAAAETELARLVSERLRFVVPALSGDADADQMKDQIDDDSAALRSRLEDLRQAKGQIDTAIRTAEAARVREAEAARPGMVAAEREKILAAALAVERSADALGAATKLLVDGCGRLAEIRKSTVLGRWCLTVPDAIRNAIAPQFDIDRSAQPRVENNYLRLVSAWHGPARGRTLSEALQTTFDDEAPFFVTAEEAEACRLRLANRNTPSIVVALASGVFTVQRVDQVFADRGEAEKVLRSNSALRNGGFAIVPFGADAFAIVAADIAGAVTEAAAA